MPAERRHGVAQERVPVAVPEDPRDAAALAGIRSGTAAQPDRSGDGTPLQPPPGGWAAAPRARRSTGDRRAAASTAVRKRDADPVVRTPRSGARSVSPGR